MFGVVVIIVAGKGSGSTVMAVLLNALVVFVFTFIIGHIGLKVYRNVQKYRKWRELTAKLPHHPVHWLFGNLDASVRSDCSSLSSDQCCRKSQFAKTVK